MPNRQEAQLSLGYSRPHWLLGTFKVIQGR